MTRCHNCGAPVEPADDYCSHCGQRRRRSADPTDGCRNCGAALVAGATYCRRCGTDQAVAGDGDTRPCWQCGATLVRRAVRCHDCGERQAPHDRARGPDEHFCHVCGTVVGPEDNFCRRCGTDQP